MLPPSNQYPVPGMMPQQPGPPPVQPLGPGMAQGGGPPLGPATAQGGPPSLPQHPAMMLISLIQQNPSIAVPILNMLQQQMAPQQPQQPQLPQGLIDGNSPYI